MCHYDSNSNVLHPRTFYTIPPSRHSQGGDQLNMGRATPAQTELVHGQKHSKRPILQLGECYTLVST